MAGRSTGMTSRGRTPPSPTPIRAKLKVALEAQKEELEVPSSSSASTIKSAKDVRSGTQTPLQHSSAFNTMQEKRPLLSREETPTDDLVNQPTSSVIEIPDISTLSIRRVYDSSRSVSPATEVVPVSTQKSSLMNSPRSFVAELKTQYEKSAMISSRYPPPSPEPTLEDSSGEFFSSKPT